MVFTTTCFPVLAFPFQFAYVVARLLAAECIPEFFARLILVCQCGDRDVEGERKVTIQELK